MVDSLKKRLAPVIQWATDEGLLSKTRTGRILKKLGRNIAETVGILENAPPAYAGEGNNQRYEGEANSVRLRRRADEEADRPVSQRTRESVQSRLASLDNSPDPTRLAPPAIRARVRLFVKKTQPSCRAVREFLEQLGVPYEEEDIGQDAQKRTWLKNASGDIQVPKIFINDTCVGGFEDLADLQATGRLDAMLACPPA
jgi:glutaredoxin 3